MMRKNLFNKQLILGILFLFPLIYNAQEGTKQVSPVSTELSGLFCHPFSNYGSYYDAPDDNSIHFVIDDYTTERFYFGFSWLEYASAGGSTTVLNYTTQNSYMWYRILDSGGAVVAGPILLDRSTSGTRPGQILTYANAIAGPVIGTYNAGGYNPVTFTPTKNDTYTIEYWRGTSTTNSTINSSNTAYTVSPLFDFTVAKTITPGTNYEFKPGRVFATKWGLVTTRANGSNQYYTNIDAHGSPTFHVYTDQNNVLKLEFPDIQPLAYFVGANGYGVTNTNNFPVDRRSINVGATAPNIPGGFNVFLSTPDPVIFPYNTTVGTPPSFAASLITPVGACNTAPYNINFTTTEPGDYRIIIKGTGYTDRILYFYDLAPGNYSMEWDGKDGTSPTALLFSTSAILSFEITALADRFNIPLFDAERNAGGIKVTTIAPVGMTASNLFWDDSVLGPFNTGTQDGNNTGAGIDNSTIGTASPTHEWTVGTGTNYYTYYGNARLINSWGYLYYQQATASSSIACSDLTITKTVNNPTPNIGSNVIFTITASNLVVGSTASGVVVNDVLPAGYTFVSATPHSGTTFTNPNWNVGTLTNGTNKTLTITATVNPDYHYTNVANISTVNFETNYNNNAAYVSVTPNAMPEITVSNLCPDPNIDVTPPKGVQLNDLHFGTVPPDASLVWFNNNTHTGSPLGNTFVTVSGSYYAFYYDSVNNCYSPVSAKVNVLILDCKCRRSPATGTPDGYTKVGITTQATKTENWPENVANGFIAMESTNKGFVITRTTSASITTPVIGMLIYDTGDNCFKLYNGTTWHCITQTCNE